MSPIDFNTRVLLACKRSDTLTVLILIIADFDIVLIYFCDARYRVFDLKTNIVYIFLTVKKKVVSA